MNSMKINELVMARKKQMQEIQHSTSDRQYFLECFNLSEIINTKIRLQDKGKNDILFRNLMLLGNFISNLLKIPNSIEKIQVLDRILQGYELYDQNSQLLESKQMLQNLPKISIEQPSCQFQQNIHGNKSSKEIFQLFMNAGRNLQVPEQINYSIIIQTLLNIVDLHYNCFIDKNFESKECSDLIYKIDSQFQKLVIQVIFDKYIYLSKILMNEEMIKCNDIIFECGDSDYTLDQYLSNTENLNIQ